MIDIYDGVVSLKDKNLLPNEPGLYFVVQDNKPIYIGQSINIQTRLMVHHRLSQFEELDNPQIYWLLVPADRLNQTEKIFIEKLQPKLNGTKVPKPKNNPMVHTGFTLVRDHVLLLDDLCMATQCFANGQEEIRDNSILPNRSKLIRLIAEGAKIGIFIELIKLIRTDKKWLTDNSDRIIEYVKSIKE